jgi:hypothetical protein
VCRTHTVTHASLALFLVIIALCPPHVRSRIPKSNALVPDKLALALSTSLSLSRRTSTPPPCCQDPLLCCILRLASPQHRQPPQRLDYHSHQSLLPPPPPPPLFTPYCLRPLLPPSTTTSPPPPPQRCQPPSAPEALLAAAGLAVTRAAPIQTNSEKSVPCCMQHVKSLYRVLLRICAGSRALGSFSGHARGARGQARARGTGLHNEFPPLKSQLVPIVSI